MTPYLPMKQQDLNKRNSTSEVVNAIQTVGLNEQATLEYLNSLAIIQDDGIHKRLQKELLREYVILEKKVDGLLKNTLPEMVASEIKCSGRFEPRFYHCTILFTDIVGFTRLAEKVSGELLIELLDNLFRGVDELVKKFKGTKIKTIGDAYMAVFGAPHAYENHAFMAVKTAMRLLDLLAEFNRQHQQQLQVRIGIHTGEVIAGVVGEERMQFDIFGDNVNIASRFESSGAEGRINVSHETFLLVRDCFRFEERGEISLKNKANMKAYFVLEEL